MGGSLQAPCTRVHMYMYVYSVVLQLVCCVCYDSLWFVSQAAMVGQGEEGKEDGECEEGLGRKEEDMSVGELTKSSAHVDAELLQK